MKKTKAKKAQPELDDRGEAPMTAAEIKKWTQIVSDLGKRKIAGAMVIVRVKEKMKDGVETEAVVMGHDCPKQAIVSAVTRSLDLNPIDLMLSHFKQ